MMKYKNSNVKAQLMPIKMVRFAITGTWSKTVRNLVGFAQVGGHSITQ